MAAMANEVSFKSYIFRSIKKKSKDLRITKKAMMVLDKFVSSSVIKIYTIVHPDFKDSSKEAENIKQNVAGMDEDNYFVGEELPSKLVKNFLEQDGYFVSKDLRVLITKEAKWRLDFLLEESIVLSTDNLITLTCVALGLVAVS